jgi:hypothetical protein
MFNFAFQPAQAGSPIPFADSSRPCCCNSVVLYRLTGFHLAVALRTTIRRTEKSFQYASMRREYREEGQRARIEYPLTEMGQALGLPLIAMT